jgi:hypothetical protein
MLLRSGYQLIHDSLLKLIKDLGKECRDVD